jgi:hypothetical protein
VTTTNSKFKNIFNPHVPDTLNDLIMNSRMLAVKRNGLVSDSPKTSSPRRN